MRRKFLLSNKGSKHQSKQGLRNSGYVSGERCHGVCWSLLQCLFECNGTELMDYVWWQMVIWSIWQGSSRGLWQEKWIWWLLWLGLISLGNWQWGGWNVLWWVCRIMFQARSMASVHSLTTITSSAVVWSWGKIPIGIKIVVLSVSLGGISKGIWM